MMGIHSEKGYATDVITDEAIQWLDQYDIHKPFYYSCIIKPRTRNLFRIKNTSKISYKNIFPNLYII